MTYISPRFDRDRAYFEASAAEDHTALALLEADVALRRSPPRPLPPAFIARRRRAMMIDAAAVVAMLGAVAFVIFMLARVVLKASF